jgi:hypothetical protein
MAAINGPAIAHRRRHSAHVFTLTVRHNNAALKYSPNSLKSAANLPFYGLIAPVNPLFKRRSDAASADIPFGKICRYGT